MDQERFEDIKRLLVEEGSEKLLHIETTKILNKSFNDLSENQKVEILQLSLAERDLGLATFVCEKMGLDINKDLEEILPVIQSAGNTQIYKRILHLGLQNKNITSRFGETHGLLALSKSLGGCVYILNSQGINKNQQYLRPRGSESWDIQKFIENAKPSLFDLLLQKDSKGEYLLRRERREKQEIFGSLESAYVMPEIFCGNLNELARACYPAEEKYLPNDNVYDFGLQRKNLQYFCQAYPDKMREMAKAVLFDVEAGEEIPFKKFVPLFLHTNIYHHVWVVDVPTLLKENILTPKEGNKLLKAFFDFKPEFPVEEYTIASITDDDGSLWTPTTRVIEMYNYLKKKNELDISLLGDRFYSSGVEEIIKNGFLKKSQSHVGRLGVSWEEQSLAPLEQIRIQLEREFLLCDNEPRKKTRKPGVKI